MTVSFNSAELEKRIRAGVMRAVVRGVESVRAEAIDLILSTAKTGRVYRRRGTDHFASAPGEPPASDTGRLVNSLTAHYDTQNLTGEVRASVEYAAYLEYGTQKMEPRPFLRPALANKQAEIEEDIAREVAKALEE